MNSYGLDLLKTGKIEASQGGPFYDLLTKILEIDRSFRLRFTTSNPHDLSYEVACLYSRFSEKLGRYYHLPVQSGSTRILEAMKRKVSRQEYEQKVKWLREAGDDMALSTDIIVGFPDETEEDFEATYDLVRQVRFSFIYAFAYSPRKKTPASRFSHQVPEKIKKQRLARLLELQNKITLEHHQNEVGQTRKVLVLYESKKEPHSYYGRTEHFRLVKIRTSREDPSLVGKLLTVRIHKASLICLEATVLEMTPASPLGPARCAVVS